MKPLFKNITIYNSDNYDQFIKFHGEKFNFSYNIYTLFMSILIIYCLILNIMQKNIIFILLFFAILFFMYLFRMYLPIKRYEKTKQNFETNEQTSVTFTFFKFYFTVDQKAYPYMKLYKVFETEEYFYLYIDAEKAVLVNKQGFKQGTVEEFTNFIKKKCLFKYSKQS